MTATRTRRAARAFVLNPLRVPFVRDVAMTSGSQASQAFLALLAGVLVARLLGPAARGTISVLLALGAMSVVVARFGVDSSGVYFLGRFKSERDSIISNVVLFGALGGLVTGGALALVGIVFESELLHGIALSLFLTYVIAVPCIFFNFCARGIVLGSGRIAMFNAPVLMEGVGLLLGTALAIGLFGRRLLPVVALRVVIEAAITVLLVVYVRKAIGFRLSPSWNLLRRQLRYGLRNYSSSFLWLFLLQSDLILCNYFLGSRQTGIYAVAVSLGVPITMLAGVVGTLTFQRVSSSERHGERIANTNRTLRLLLPLVAVAVAGVGSLSPWFVPLVFGSEFRRAALALILLLPGLVALSLELVPINFLAGEGSPPIVYLGPAAGLAVNVGANVVVIPRWGINGASITSSVGYVLVLVIVLAYYLRATQTKLHDVLLLRKDDVRAVWLTDTHPDHAGVETNA